MKTDKNKVDQLTFRKKAGEVALKYVKIQKAMWDFFQKEISTLQKEKSIDILVCNGDAIDGDGFRSNATELITSDRLKQVSIAKQVINFIDAQKNIIVCGTAYHTGNAEDFTAKALELLV